MTLLGGGGYSEYVRVKSEHLIDIKSVDKYKLEEWAGVPEVWLTSLMLTRLAGIHINNLWTPYTN